MMIYKNKILVILTMVLTIVSCNDPYNDKPADASNDYTGGPKIETELDKWLYQNFTLPYNIDVKYRQDASEVDLYKTLVPPDQDKVLDVMDVVGKVWIEPYTSLAGQNFIKEYCPKQFVLVGSARYNFDGSITLGTAEGGRKVVLYVVNDFLKTDRYAVKEMIHTIEHEFTHILNQKVSYPATLKEITAGGYTANWNTVSLSQARQLGFITSYAMVSPDEDIAEMVAMMLVEGKTAYENILNCETTSESYMAIRQKEKIIVDYFQKAFTIDLYALQTKVQEAIEAVAPGGDPGNGDTPPEPLLDVWGANKQYTTLNIDLMTMPESANLTARYTSDNNVLHGNNMALDYNFKLSFYDTDLLLLTLYYYTINAETRVYKEANFVFRYTDLFEQGTLDLTFLSGDDNADYLVNTLGASALYSYFKNSFYAQWAQTCSGYWYPALFPVESTSDYCIGVLGN